MQIELSKHRIEALTDGLFAIVMTLIVLDLKIPELAKPVADEELLQRLSELRPHFFIFGLTFLVSAMFWFLHHQSLQHIRHMTRTLIWINLGFLLFVSVLPFSAGLWGRYPSSRVATTVYYGNQFALGVLLASQWAYARSKALVVETIEPRLRTSLDYRLWLIPLAALGALVGAAVRPGLAAYGFLIMIVVGRAVVLRVERKLVGQSSH